MKTVSFILWKKYNRHFAQPNITMAESKKQTQNKKEKVRLGF